MLISEATISGHQRDFGSEIDAILSQPLIPDSIDTYAINALKKLVDLSGEVTEIYNRLPTIYFGNGKQAEDVAFNFFGVHPVDYLLEHISTKSEEIVGLDRVITRAIRIGQVIVPPASQDPLIIAGNGTFEGNNVTPRVKTLLFVLSNDFDIDIHDDNELLITTGEVDDKMMRQTSYTAVEVPKIDRCILICDEEGNITFVFDTARLREIGVSTDVLVNMPKPELDELIQQNTGLGKRVRYSKNFVNNLATTIQDPSIVSPARKSPSYLYPKAPEGVLPRKAMSEEWGVSNTTLDRVIDDLKIKLGPVGRFRFKYHSTEGFDTEQQALIKQELAKKGVFAPSAPEGILSVKGLADAIGVSRYVVRKVAKNLGEELGEVGTYRFTSAKSTAATGEASFVAEGFDLEQQDRILGLIPEDSVMPELPPEGVLSINDFAKQVKVTYPTIRKVIDELGTELGKLNAYFFSNNRGYSLDEDQQALVKNALAERGLLAPLATEDILAAKPLARSLGVSRKALACAVEELGEELGEVMNYRFYSNISTGYDKTQQQKIADFLKAQGKF